MLLSSRLWIASVVTAVALVVGVAIPFDAALAITRVGASSAGIPLGDAPALPSVDETAESPAMPSGSFSIPDTPDVVEPTEAPAAVERPPISDAVAEWEKRSVPTTGLRLTDEKCSTIFA